MRGGHLGERVRQRRSSLRNLPGERHVRGRCVQQLRLPKRLLHGDDVQPALHRHLRGRRPRVYGVRRHGGRWLQRRRRLYLRREERVRRRTEMRGRPLRVRLDLVSRLLRRDDLQPELGRNLRSRRRLVRRLRLDPGRQLLGERRLSMRAGSPLQLRPALLSGRVRLRRHVLSQWLLHRNRVHSADADHLRGPRRDLRRLRSVHERQVFVGGRLLLRVGRPLRRRAAMPQRQVRVRPRLVPEGLLRERPLSARERRRCVRERRQHLRELPCRPDLRRWGLFGLHADVHHGVLLRTYVQRQVSDGLRRRRRGLRCVRYHEIGRVLDRRSMPLRYRSPVRRRASVCRRRLRLRRCVVPHRVLRRNDVHHACDDDLRAQGDCLRGMRRHEG
jgi:hypothetical protein